MGTTDIRQALSSIENLRHRGLLEGEFMDGSGFFITTSDGLEYLRSLGTAERTSDTRQTPFRCAKLAEVNVGSLKCFAGTQTLRIARDGTVPRWTILIGDNGVGKTTILRVIAALAPELEVEGHEQAIIPRVQRRSDLQSAFRERDVNGRGYLAETVFRTITDKGVRHLVTGVTEQSKMSELFPRLNLGTGTAMMTQGRAGLVYVGGNDLVGQTLVLGYGATRAVGSVKLAQESQTDDGVETLFQQDRPLRNPEELLLRYDYARKLAPNDAQAAARYERIKRVLITILPGVQGIEISPADEGEPTPVVRFQTGLALVPFTGLALGFQSTIAWVVDLASRMFINFGELEDPLSGSALVLIDEIDLHLHPVWQRTLLGDLEHLFPNVQFVVTTHSPLVVQGATDARIYLLRRGDLGVEIIEESQEVTRWRVDQILTSDLFGLKSPRSKYIGDLDRRRTALLAQTTLTDIDRAEVQRLDVEIGDLPLAESQADREALAFLRDVNARLKQP